MSKSDFSDVLAKIPYGVSVVTTGRGGVENGLTVSWMSQVSFDPPMLMVAVDKLHYSVDLFRSTKNFCVNLLGEGQIQLAGHFAKQAVAGDDKLTSPDVAQRPADSGAAILTEAVAYFDCEISSMVEAGDHLLVIGRIEDAGLLTDGAPLRSDSGLRYRKK
jgi:flavin reductase (DIM6/NTAB) family NADH-FMN oxidoreductase RutF